MRKTSHLFAFVLALTSLAGCLSDGELDEELDEELDGDTIVEASSLSTNLVYTPLLAEKPAATMAVTINFTKGMTKFRVDEIVYEVHGARNNNKLGVDVEVLSNGKWIELVGNWDFFYTQLGNNGGGVFSPKRVFDTKGRAYRFKVYASFDYVGPDKSKSQYLTVR